MNPKKFSEWRVLAILGIVALSWHLLTIFGAFLAVFAGVFLILVLAFGLALVLEPLVARLSRAGLSRVWAAAAVYLALAAGVILIFSSFLPAVVDQFPQLAGLIPAYLPQNSLVTAKIVDFLSGTASNTLNLAAGAVSLAANLALIFIFSFYFLLSRQEISRLVSDFVPEKYQEYYQFLEKTLSQTFAAFLRVQAVLALATGALVFVTLAVLGVNFALAFAIVAAILALVPAAGAVLFFLPVVLAAITMPFQKLILAVVICLLGAQLIYNVLGPKLWGSALKVHPIIILLSFLIGYRLAGLWGAIFAVPVTSALTVVGRDLLKYWREEADK